MHKNRSQLCILTEAGEMVEKRIRTERKRLEEVLGGRAKARVLIDASTESEWVARCLEELGHKVIVADPNYAPMYTDGASRALEGGYSIEEVKQEPELLELRQDVRYLRLVLPWDAQRR